ncbi:uncharacterized protein BXZ73DRAFT_76525 [Epithele typhae]|uniref:uncharacterized protein n=1 Tax=Epithele typhae TaxID=378194 RepID=UPI0020080958|nr:uncharacterized protein BXZ73DRAFT_76525 [Epithele typhae]KAH9937897.1 hypothetical protein BXZ73DRAFT_76525 [Epithele typhae]
MTTRLHKVLYKTTSYLQRSTCGQHGNDVGDWAADRTWTWARWVGEEDGGEEDGGEEDGAKRTGAWAKWSLGATHVIDHALPIPELLAAVFAAASSAPMFFAYDAIGMENTQRLAYATLGDHGGFVSVMPRAGPEVLAPVQREGDGKPVVRPFASFQMLPNQVLGVGVDKRLTGWLADGTAKPNRGEWTRSQHVEVER